LELLIDVRHGQLGLSTKSNSFNLRQESPEVKLNIKQPAVKLDVSQPVIRIDQRVQFAQLGYRHPVVMTRYYGQQGQQTVSQGTKRRVQEGRLLADIQRPISVAELAASREQVSGKKQLTIKALPKTPPQIDFLIRPVVVNLAEGEVEGRFKYGRVLADNRMGQVDVYLRQKPDVQVQFAGSAVDFAI
jgi:hypothetical protein